MIPIEPKLNLDGWRNVIFAEHQKEYQPLPCIIENAPRGTVITRWKLSWKERIRMFIKGEMWLTVLTFHHPLQPILMDSNPPKFTYSDTV